MIELTKEQIEKYDKILDKGLSAGLNDGEGRVCIEAAICKMLALPHGDNPPYVGSAVRAYKIKINDSIYWSSPKSRSIYLRDIGIAQIGSNEINQIEFSTKLAKKTIQIIIPKLFRESFSGRFKDIVKRCEIEGSKESAKAAADATYAAANATYANIVAYTAAYTAANIVAYNAANAAYAAYVAADAADAANATYADDADDATYADDAANDAANAAAYAAAYAAADAAAYAADATAKSTSEEYLILSVNIALDILKEMNSPGVKYL